MSWLAKLWAALRGWFGRRFQKPARPPPPLPSPGPEASLYRVVHADEEPDELAPMVMYAIGEGMHLWRLWHVTMLCPCGCEAMIQLNTLADASPCWTLIERDGVPTLRPAVWRKVGCQSHFFLRNGRIEWCGNHYADVVS